MFHTYCKLAAAVIAALLLLAAFMGCSDAENRISSPEEKITVNEHAGDNSPPEFVGISADSVNALGRAAMLAEGGKSIQTDVSLGWQLYVSVPFYSQRDPHWQYDRLGWSSLYIRDYGCHLSCVAMHYAKWGYGHLNPHNLNNWGKSHDAFSGPNVIPYKIVDYAKNRNVRYISANQIYSELAAGHPVIVRTTYGGSHFMIIFAFDGRRYWVKDPLRDWRHQDQPLYGNAHWDRPFRVYGY